MIRIMFFFKLSQHFSSLHSQAREAYLQRHQLRKEFDDTFTTVLGLHFDVSGHHFLDGKMTLKCTSSMLSIYWQSREVSL